MTDQDKMVSNQEEVILVDHNNQPIGTMDKYEAHRGKGRLHRAITVVLFNQKGELLITKRSDQKPLWPLWFDAACSTHQWPGESAVDAAARRLPFEIGINIPAGQLQQKFIYEYHAVYNDQWSENEINHIVIGQTDDTPKLNPAEAAEFSWQSRAKIATELATPNHRYAPWFEILFERLD